MHRLFIACVAGASALKVRDEKRVLFLGSSPDRNAVVDFCDGHAEQTTTPLQTAWCFKKEPNVKVGYIWHPGVGQHGDLHEPFAVPRVVSTGKILVRYANKTSFYMLQADPHMVVVDSSLWDLMVWRLGTTGQRPMPEPKEVTEERVQQWCQYDLPGLLGNVSKQFPKVRIAFRTAPTIEHTPKYEKFEKRDIELLYKCIISNTNKGLLFGKYWVIDYHAMMNMLIDRKVPDLFRDDGYHPSPYPSAWYMKEVLARVGVEVPVPKRHPNGTTAEDEAALKGDPNVPDLMRSLSRGGLTCNALLFISIILSTFHHPRPAQAVY